MAKGLLDFISTPEGQGLLSAAFGGLAGARRGTPFNNLGRAGLAGLGGYVDATDRMTQQSQIAKRDQMYDLQLKQAQQQMADAEARRQAAQRRAMTPAQVAASKFGGPTMAAAEAAPNTPAGYDYQGYSQDLAAMGDITGSLAIQQMLKKDTTPIKVGANERLLEPGTNRVLVDALPDAAKVPSDIQGYNLAKQEGYRGTYTDWLLGQKRAGATNVSVNTGKTLLNTVAEGLGKNIDTSLSTAQAAIPAIQTAQTLKQAVDSGKMISGPGSTFRVLGLQVGQMLGVGGASGAEVLSNTRTAIQSMAKAELDAAAQMKGQGQITEAERGIIKRAAAGDIDSLTAPEIRLLAEGMEKTARFKIRQHQNNVSKLAKVPGAEPIMPFYSIEEPAAYSGGSGGVRKFNPVTGKIE